mmetsp:Transcript_14060/g.32570  ORF Transcript_14060/g.32570 Transcript_14060/m.32570 type:complete len:89 (-) Transcript_14060:566-832(-)
MVCLGSGIRVVIVVLLIMTDDSRPLSPPSKFFRISLPSSRSSEGRSAPLSFLLESDNDVDLLLSLFLDCILYNEDNNNPPSTSTAPTT